VPEHKFASVKGEGKVGKVGDFSHSRNERRKQVGHEGVDNRPKSGADYNADRQVLLEGQAPGSAAQFPTASHAMVSPGFFAALGIPLQRSIQMAVDEFNSARGVGGRPLRVQYEDGKCDENEAATAAQKLVGVNKVKYIIGGACSGETLGFAPIAKG